MLPKALAVATTIGDEYYRYYDPEALTDGKGKSNRTARRDEYYRYRPEALTGLDPHLPEVLPKIARAIFLEITRARAIGSEFYFAEVLTSLAPHLPENFLPEALEITRAIGDENSRTRVLTGLAPHLFVTRSFRNC